MTAARLNATSRRRDSWQAHGVTPDYDAIRAKAWSEAVNCPVCDRAVHPTNMQRHMDLYHAPRNVVTFPKPTVLAIAAWSESTPEIVRVAAQVFGWRVTLEPQGMYYAVKSEAQLVAQAA